METEQSQFWGGAFGAEYTDRNTRDDEYFENDYIINYGITKRKMNEDFLQIIPRDIKILEVGCNIGMQLIALQKMGFTHLNGIELQAYAVEKAKKICNGINIRQGSGFEIPFADSSFDLVYTHGVLIHVHPNDLSKIMNEIFRVSSKYIWGFEYYSDELKEINYRGHSGVLWKTDYCNIFQKLNPEFRVIKKEIYPYLTENNAGNMDCMYLLSK